MHLYLHILLQGRARQLYKAGYRNLQSIAKADAREVKEKIPYLSNKIVMQIIAAAKVSCHIITNILIQIFNFILFMINSSF